MADKAVRDPAQPVVVSSVAVTKENEGPFSVLLRGDYALTGMLFGSRDRLAVLDVKDLAKPRVVHEILDPMSSQVSGSMLGNLCLSVAWDRNACLVFDLADASLPKLVAKLVDPRLGKPNRCIVSGDRAYLPMVEGDGVAVLDIHRQRAGGHAVEPVLLARERDKVPLPKHASG